MKLVVCTQSGTILEAGSCYLVDSDQLEQYITQHDLSEDCDQDVINAVRKVGAHLEAQ